jgi:two-component system, chemotaxis family, chemotaxis protein CheY
MIMARLAFDLSQLRVLLIEDDTFSREFERTALHQVGITKLTIVRDTVEAVDALDRGVPCDLIISNWNLPAFDGDAFAATVRQDRPGVSLLMLTNSDSIEDISPALNSGADGCLIRPFSLDKLREAIQLALINKLTAGPVTTSQASDSLINNPELVELTASMNEILASQQDAEDDRDPAVWKDVGHLAAQLTAQLNSFISTLGVIDDQQLAVIRLHVNCLQAVLTGHPSLLGHELRNSIVDGLNFAAEIASDGQGDKS